MYDGSVIMIIPGAEQIRANGPTPPANDAQRVNDYAGGLFRREPRAAVSRWLAALGQGCAPPRAGRTLFSNVQDRCRRNRNRRASSARSASTFPFAPVRSAWLTR